MNGHDGRTRPRLPEPAEVAMLKTKRTSIGQSPHSHPKNKNKRHHWKRSRGQGHKRH